MEPFGAPKGSPPARTGAGALWPLSSVPSGRRVTVTALEGGHAFQSRVMSMGVSIGSRVEVLQGGDEHLGPLVIAVGQTRLALGRGMAQKIIVSSDHD